MYFHIISNCTGVRETDELGLALYLSKNLFCVAKHNCCLYGGLDVVNIECVLTTVFSVSRFLFPHITYPYILYISSSAGLCFDAFVALEF